MLKSMGFCLLCQTKKEARCLACDAATCGLCQQNGGKCPECHEVSVEVMTPRQDKQLRKRTRQQKAEAGVVNMHNLGRDFIQTVTGVRWKNTAKEDDRDRPAAEAIEFEAVIRQGAQEDRRTLIDDLLSKTDHELVRNLTTATPPLILRIPNSLFENFQPSFGDTEWWYRADGVTNVWTCPVCEEIKEQDPVAKTQKHICQTCARQRRRNLARRKAQMSQSYAWECGAERLTRDTSTSITRKRAGTSPLMCPCLKAS